MTKDQENFIKVNQKILKEIFQDRIEQLKNSIFSMSNDEDRDLEIRFVQEYQEWLRTIEVFNEKKGKTDTNKIYR